MSSCNCSECHFGTGDIDQSRIEKGTCGGEGHMTNMEGAAALGLIVRQGHWTIILSRNLFIETAQTL